MCWALDLLVILRMHRCDVFICMSGIYLAAARFSKWRYGAKLIVHRGSRHILSQQEILSSLPEATQVSQFIVSRELENYAIADYIAVPSTHVAESFAPWPELARKLFLNPYGVDLEQFPLRRNNPPAEPTVLFVGNWTYRKGVDVLADAIANMPGVRLVHVGALGDAPFPTQPQLFHHEPVPQWQLRSYYEASHVFVLASREDGFGLVLSQALASGLPVVCTDRTGGPDLAQAPGLAKLIQIVPAGDSNALRCALTDALKDAMGSNQVTILTDAERENLSWKAYALRDLHFIAETLSSLAARSA
jgi:glycosyltransferase involved in cell wall biosynthesis